MLFFGYATPIRRAQDASLDYVCLCFDADVPPDGAMAMWVLIGARVRRAFIILKNSVVLIDYL